MSKEPSHAAMPTRKYRPSGQSAEPVDTPVREANLEPAVEQQGVDDPVGEIGPAREPSPSAEAEAPVVSVQGSGTQPDLIAMDEAPLDRRIILKADDGREVEASWRVTRQYVPAPKGGAWHETGVWAIWNSGGAKVPFEPVGWREAP